LKSSLLALTLKVTVPVVAVAGTVVVSVVAVAAVTVAVTPLNFTTLSATVVLKFVPVIVTTPPALPDVGLIEVMVAQELLAAVAYWSLFADRCWQ
jgi:hypothetical protein